MSAIAPIDGALLALVADDRVASKVLSVWVSMRLPASTTDAVIVRECSSMGISYADTAIKRLRAAGLIVDGGTTAIGLRWLHAVAAELTGSTGKRKAKRT